jgi:penicillin amidase
MRLVFAGALQRPRPQSVADRLIALPLRGLPVEAPVVIYWSEQLVPFVEARSDGDLATALGLVHAHLRLAQMELLRRVARGRLAEIAGPVAVPLDHTLRVLDLARAVPAILAGLPKATRDWLDRFVAGINHHIAFGVPPPIEFRLLGLAPEPWTAKDVLAVARLAAADVNWLIWLRLLRLPRGEDWPQTWARLLADGAAPLPSLGSGRADLPETFARLVLGTGRAGSNALAVAGGRSATGRPWLAGDPHLPLSLPSVWVAGSYRSPSYNVAGLMIPGIPVMAIGRNPTLAWGGTNLHAASSELFDVSTLPPSQIVERRERMTVRWSQPREITVRDTEYGPIISDTPLFAAGDGRALALRWVGHLPSDEITALLAINRARDAAELRHAAGGFAVPGQNLVFADAAGRIGRMTAAWLPRRPAAPPQDLVSPPTAAASWAQLANPADLPAEMDPPGGFVVSANNRPPTGDVPVGWFFSPNDRVEQLAAVLGSGVRIGMADITGLLTDVAAPGTLAWRDRLCAELAPPPVNSRVFDALLGWDGRYEAGSPGALAFELVVARLIETQVPPERWALLGIAWHSRKLLLAEIDDLAPERRIAAIRAAVTAARKPFRRLQTWGGAHRLRLAHPFGALPGIGRRFRFIDWAWPGSNDTVFKSAHDPVDGRHPAAYGSDARYIFDLADPDANRLVILGGQDGAPGSAAFADQAELFRRGEYVQLPLQPATARAQFPHRIQLEP